MTGAACEGQVLGETWAQGLGYGGTGFHEWVAPSGAVSVRVTIGLEGEGTAHFDGLSVDPIVKGDFDNDDKADLVLLNQNTGAYEAWGMNGTTRVQQWPISPQPGIFTTLVGVEEFTHDGYADLVFQGSLTGGVEIWPMAVLSGQLVRMGPAQALDAQPSPGWRVMGAGRFEDPDWFSSRSGLVLRHSTTNDLQVWLLDGSHWQAMMAPSPSQVSSAAWKLVGTADYNRDGRSDFLFYNQATNRLVTWYMGDGLVRISGQYTTPDAVPTPLNDPDWQPVATADYGRGVKDLGTALLTGPKGTGDIVWRASADGQLLVWHMDANSHLVQSLPTTPSAPADALAWRVVGPR